MKKTILILALILTPSALVLAQLCPDTPPGYQRSYRPDGEPANYPPVAAPACFQRGTNEAANYLSCYLCHDHMWRNQV